MLRTHQLSRVLPDGTRLVDDITVDIHAGDVVALIGPSGAGKSSFLRLLNRLDEPTSGTVYLNGQDYRELPPRALRQRVGMVMQTPYLFPGTVADNLRFGPRQRNQTTSEVQVENLLERVGLGGYGRRDVANLSGGEAQRVSLARTLANEPQVLLLDEPTSALDAASQREVEQLIGQIIQQHLLTCVMITHDMAQAARMARQAMVMERGRLLQVGSVREVLHA